MVVLLSKDLGVCAVTRERSWKIAQLWQTFRLSLHLHPNQALTSKCIFYVR